MTARTFDTLAAARELTAAAIRAGQGELASRDDVAGVPPVAGRTEQIPIRATAETPNCRKPPCARPGTRSAKASARRSKAVEAFPGRP